MSDKENSDLEKSTSELIDLLEQEMRSDLLEINISKEDEASLTIDNVKEWYINTEKLVRVIANILGEVLHQPINQLRYAGHHLVLHYSSSRPQSSDLVEAYKHCKRATYDALDAYLFSLNQKYSNHLPYLTSQAGIKLEHQVLTLINESIKFRAESTTRIEYYQKVMSQVVAGLRLIEQVNEAFRETGYPDALLKEKQQIVDELIETKRKTVALAASNTELSTIVAKQARVSGQILAKVGLFITVTIVVLAALSHVIFESKHVVTINQLPAELRMAESVQPDSKREESPPK